MNSLTFLRLLLFALSVAQISFASQSYSHVPALRRHKGLSRYLPGIQPRQQRKCKPRPHTSESSEPKETSTKSSDKSSTKSDQGSNNEQSSPKGDVIQVSSDRCGPSGATAKTSKTTGPNGSIDWLNCGLESGGWNPPTISIDQLITVSLDEAVKKDDSPFKPCSEFIGLFNKYGGQYNIPPIMLASFAMQESSCRPETVGGAGEQGLMQITKDKCGGAPGGNCRDPDFNIRTGAKYFRDTLSANDGNVLLSIGQYNGWNKGMTVGEAQQWFGGNCRTQRNLDYLHQFVNGWCQNINVYGSERYGKYFNLDKCN